MKRLLTFMALSLALSPALAQETKPGEKPDAPPLKAEKPAPPPADAPAKPSEIPLADRTAEQRLFDEAAEAVLAAKAVSFRANIAGTDGMKQAYPTSRVELKALRTTGGGFNGWLIRVTGTMERKDKDPQDIDLAWTAGGIEVLDTDKKELIERPVRQTTQGPGLQVANAARFKEIFTTQPYQMERDLAGKGNVSYTSEGTKTIDGVECDVVVVNRLQALKADDPPDTERVIVGRTRWALGKTDKFPRLYEQMMEGIISGTVRVELSGVSVENAEPASVKPEDLRVPLREGFKETRVGAAVRPAPTLPAVATTSEESGEEKAVAPADPVVTAPVIVEAPAPTGPRPAPLFDLKTPSGEAVKLADLKGKVVVVQFFGSWCLDCPEWTQRLSAAVKPLAPQGVEMLALSFREKDDSNATSALAEGDYGFRHLVKCESAAAEYGVRTFPATYVIDREGIIAGSWQGETSDESAQAVAAAVTTALGPKG